MPRTQETPTKPQGFKLGDRVYTFFGGPGTVVDGRRRVNGKQYVQVLLDVTVRRWVNPYTSGYFADELSYLTPYVERCHAEKLCYDFGLTARCADLYSWHITSEVYDGSMKQFTERCYFCEREGSTRWASAIAEGEVREEHRRLPVCALHQDMLLKEHGWGETAEERERQRRQAQRNAYAG